MPVDQDLSSPTAALDYVRRHFRFGPYRIAFKSKQKPERLRTIGPDVPICEPKHRQSVALQMSAWDTLRRAGLDLRVLDGFAELFFARRRRFHTGVDVAAFARAELSPARSGRTSKSKVRFVQAM